VKLIPIFVILVSLTAKANFKELSNEFLRENASVQSLIGNSLKADQGIKFVESSLAPKFGGGASFVDNNSDSANAVNFAAGKTTSVDLNFSKATSWGGVFSLNNSFEKVIQDPSRIIIFGGDPEIHQFKQTISFATSLTRNIFGQEFDLNLNSSILNAEYVDLLSQSSLNDLMMQFSQAYSRAVLSKELFDLQARALERAKKRLVLVKRRVSDGINLKADLYRAESAKVFQEEQLDQAKQELNKALFSLSSHLHREVLVSEIGTVKNITAAQEGIKNYSQSIKKEQPLIDSRKRFAENQELEKEKSARKMLPEMNFSVAYQTNDYDAESSNVFDKGNLGGDRNTLSVGLEFTYNFGRVSERASLTQAEINHNQALHQLSAAHENVKNRRLMLQENLRLSTNNIRKATRRVELSTSIINEYVKLFSLGRVTLDQVIQAEEDLINSERRLAQQVAANFTQFLELASLDYFLPDLVEGNF